MASSANMIAPAPYDIEQVRQDFPGLHQRVHGHPLAYLDNGASAQMPRSVLQVLEHHYQIDRSNIHRGVHSLSGRATEAYEQARTKVARFLGAGSAQEVVFVRGTTEAINLVAESWGGAHLREGDEVLLTEMEHHSNIVPWQLLRDRLGITLKVLPITPTGELDMGALPQLLTNRTKLVALVHVSNALGTVNNVRAVVEQAHGVGAKVLVDGAQAVPHAPVNVAELGCDFYAFSGHKLYGPSGIGVLWARPELLEAMPPWQGGGGMIRMVTFDKTTYAPAPERFEAGTPNVAGAIGLGAAVDYVEGVGLEAIASYEQDLLAYAESRLSEVGGLRIIGTAQQKAAVISMTLEPIHPHDLGTILDQHGIAVRAGHHCTQPLMKRFGVAATARASLGMYNTRQEVDRLVDALRAAKKLFGVSGD